MNIHSLRRFFRLLHMVLVMSVILVVSTLAYRLVTGSPPTEMQRNLIASVIWAMFVIGAQLIVDRRIRQFDEKSRDSGLGR